jgi:predicted nuclease of predicted toxin-antitoxin system
LLLDENAESGWFASCLRKAGHDIACLRDLVPKGASDRGVLELAAHEQRVLYTRDRDSFDLSISATGHPGIILEFVTGTPGDMSYAQIVEAIAVIESRYPDLSNQVIIVNSFRPSD